MTARILVVDDDQMVRKVVCLAIEHDNDYAISQAEDALSAMALLDREQFNVVITDKNMAGTEHPQEGGLDVLRYAKIKNPGCGVLMMTGFASVDSAIEAMRLGAFDYCSKPVRNAELREKVARILSYQKALDPMNTVAAYENFLQDYLAIENERQDMNTGLGPKTKALLLKALQDNLDALFQEQRAREALILDQRDALSRIAALAWRLRERLPADSKEEDLVGRIIAEADRRL